MARSIPARKSSPLPPAARNIHPLGINPAGLHGFDAIRDLDDLARGDIGIGEGMICHELFHAATRSSLSSPRMTILSASSGSGRCRAFASSHGCAHPDILFFGRGQDFFLNKRPARGAPWFH